jgi:hypothetical protein
MNNFFKHFSINILQKQHIFLKPFIIGLGLDMGMKQAFNCVGTYFDAEQEVARQARATAQLERGSHV